MYVVIFITAKDRPEADRIAQGLVERKLIACANIIEGVKSVFWWEEKVDRARETLLILKSKKDLFPKIVTAVKSLHSYEVPEIIALPVIDGNQDYLGWIGSSVRG